MNGWRVTSLGALLVSLTLLAACGQPGSPQPPSLELPRAVENLSVTRRGDRVTLRWLPPNRFTDGRTIRRPGPSRVCRVPGDVPAVHCEVIATLPAATKATSSKTTRETVEYQDLLPPSLLQGSPTGSVMYGIEVLNRYGRSVGLSNQVSISTAPSLPPPVDVAATVNDTGIALRWNSVTAPSIAGVTFAYQISRRPEGGEYAAIATVPIGEHEYLDQTMEWEKRYDYRLDVLTESADNRDLVVGEDSNSVNVFAHDVFAPAAPRDLQAVFSGPGQQPFIDLSWSPNLEADLAGYNVFRREGDSTPEKITNDLVTAPSFRDQHVEAGKTYFYTITAVDQRGNESGHSAEASESVPQ